MSAHYPPINFAGLRVGDKFSFLKDGRSFYTVHSLDYETRTAVATLTVVGVGTQPVTTIDVGDATMFLVEAAQRGTRAEPAVDELDRLLSETAKATRRHQLALAAHMDAVGELEEASDAKNEALDNLQSYISGNLNERIESLA